MKAVILAGGLGTRFAEETVARPKPMIEIGGKPILWHIMKIYSAHGINDFVVCLGYKGYVIKEYFTNYLLHNADLRIDFTTSAVEMIEPRREPWRITLVDTGESTMTGGRLKRVRKWLDDEDFCFTYGDGVGDVDVRTAVNFHRAHGRLATLTATQPPGRFGALNLEGNAIRSFTEKPRGDGGWVNGGFFVLSPRAIDYVDGDSIMWEHEPLERLARDGQLQAFKHDGFWMAMDTVRDRNELEALWVRGNAPWKVW
ncbi:MAG: glucose-1-phosphate cytidylyltransferase [Gammaproteobacteria bacterium]